MGEGAYYRPLQSDKQADSGAVGPRRPLIVLSAAGVVRAKEIRPARTRTLA